MRVSAVNSNKGATSEIPYAAVKSPTLPPTSFDKASRKRGLSGGCDLPEPDSNAIADLENHWDTAIPSVGLVPSMFWPGKKNKTLVCLHDAT